jgi:HD-like signal output (HDOD) protein
VKEKKSFDTEIFEIFKDEFRNNIFKVRHIILELNERQNYKEAVNGLFRIFHGLKANSRYFGFETIEILADKVEKLLGILRETHEGIDASIYEWLFDVADQLSLWEEEMQTQNGDYSKAPSALLERIYLLACDDTSSEKLQTLQTLYLDTNPKRSLKVIALLEEQMRSVIHVSTLEAFEKTMDERAPDICMVNTCYDDVLIALQIFHKSPHDAAFIFVADEVKPNEYIRYGVEEIYHILQNPINAKELRRELLSLVDAHFTERRYIITNTKIQNFIKKLQPLSASLLQIQQVCNDDELSIKDLINVVKVDPIISGMILKAAKDPLYGLENVNTIHHAITIFGKSRVEAIALSSVVDEFRAFDLAPYGMSDALFSKVAALRLTLMMKWYAKVSVSSLSVLSTSAILGNLGQILLAKELITLGKTKEFFDSLAYYSIRDAEEKFLHTTTAHVTSDILRYWRLDNRVLDSIRLSDYLNVEKQSDLYPLVLANHVVYNLISLDGTIATEVPEYLQNLLAQQKIALEPLQKALEFIHELLNK